MKKVVSVLCVAVLLVSMICMAACSEGTTGTNQSIDGTWKVIEMNQGGTDMTSALNGYTVTLTVSGSKATLDILGQTQDWTVDQTAKTMTIDGVAVPYKVDGNKLTIEDSSGKMVFERQ